MQRGVQSVDTSGVVLEALCSFDRAVPLKDIAEYCDIPPSKAHRYLTSLVRIGLASQHSDTGLYDLGPTSLRLGITALSRDDAIRRAEHALTHVAQRARTTGHISVWGEGGPVVVRVEHGGTPIVTSLGLGTFVPLLNSSAGHVFLAYMSDGATKRLSERERRRAGHQDESLDEVKARVRESGYSRVNGTLVPGLSAVSGPVLHFDGSLACVITLVMLDSESFGDDSGVFSEFIDQLVQANQGTPYSIASLNK